MILDNTTALGDRTLTARVRRWCTVGQIADEFPFTPAVIRMLVHRRLAHNNAKGEWVPGNGLGPHISQPGGKRGKILIDAIGFGLWLESWSGGAADARQIKP